MTDDRHTAFLAVDLDIVSTRSLQPLVDAFGRSVIVNYVGREGRRHTAHLGLGLFRHSADAVIRAWVRRVEKLPPPARRLWDAALAREFNIGIQAGLKPFSHQLRIEAETVRQLARVNGRIGVTTYAPARPARTVKRGQRS